MTGRSKVMSADERRQLLDTPIRINVVGGRSWAGSVKSSRVPVNGRRVPADNRSFGEDVVNSPSREGD